jgi:uncharacterized protein YuzE
MKSGKYDISKEIADGIIVDYTKDGKVISIEILDASKRMPRKSIEYYYWHDGKSSIMALFKVSKLN